MPNVREIAALLDAALAAELGSAAAVSIGERGVELERLAVGTVRRIPAIGAPAEAAEALGAVAAVDDRTAFDLASLTKPIATAALAMALVGEGGLALDAPIRRWFPVAASSGTVGQLLGHAAGLAAHAELFRSLRELPLGDDRYAALVDQAVRYPAAAPGAVALYSDLGYIALGAIVECAAGMALDRAFDHWVAGPLELAGARYPGRTALPAAVATEIDDRGLVSGLVHDENAYVAGGVCGHAGLFGSIGDVARFAAAITETAAGRPRGRWRSEVVQRFLTTAAAPDTTWRLGWDTPSAEPGVSHAGDRWPRAGAVGHTGFTGTSLWLDLPRGRWVALLTNRVHPTRRGTAEPIKALRRAVGDAACALLDRR
jgi:CubicO group peptidase (beta-lactamase class C family)